MIDQSYVERDESIKWNLAKYGLKYIHTDKQRSIMTKSRDLLLAEIKKGLRVAWDNSKRKLINEEVYLIQDTEGKGAAGAKRNRKRKELEEASGRIFEASWAAQLENLIRQYNGFYLAVEDQLLRRHPWLNDETESSQDSLKDMFLLKTIRGLLFDLLEKPLTTKKWEEILIRSDVLFTWKEIDRELLAYQIEGYPLSNPDFYNDRPLPSSLAAPFNESPTRYDLYRLLKKTYPDSFKSRKLENDISCTAMAPLHIKELSKLSPSEWAHFETILLNIGTEKKPEWVLLDKKQGLWTVYVPPFLEGKCRGLVDLAQFGINAPVTHTSDANYSEIDAWHAVLLSRVLPWCRLPDVGRAERPLEDYRSTIPIALLHQNALEASCLPAQNKAAHASNKAFSKRYPLSLPHARDWYAAELQSVQLETPYLLPGIPPETPANLVMNALDVGTIVYDPHHNQLMIMDPDQCLEGMKLVYYQHVTTLVIAELPPQSLRRWFEYNLELTTIELPIHPDTAYIYACAARNRFFASTDYVSRSPNIIEAGHQAWDNTGRYIYQFLNNNLNPDPMQLKHIAEMGKEGLDVFFTYLATLPRPSLSCTLNLDSGKTIDTNEYIDHLTHKIRLARKPLLTKLDLVLPMQLTEATQVALVALVSALNERGEMTEVNFLNPRGLNRACIKKLNDLAQQNPSMLLQIKIPEWDAADIVETVKGSYKASYRNLQNTILGNIRQERETVLIENTLSIDTPWPVRHLKRTQVIEDDHSWHAEVSYSLTSTGSVGVQQQAQQEVAQQAEQEAEQQSQPKSAPAREILEYKGRVNDLITRQNVGQKGATEQDFSLWVGSRTDAQFVIQGMDAAAFRKIQAFPSLFQFGVDWKNTPGFRLSYLPNSNRELILTYTDADEVLDLEQQPDPFAIQMKYRKEATAFCGDYRQMHTLAFKGQENELTPWNHLATETLSEAIQSWLRQNHCNPVTSETLQYDNVHSDIKHALDLSAMIAMMKEWSRATLSPADSPLNVADFMSDEGFDDSFLSAMFDDMTPDNLRAFGQLFYHYGAKGTENWLHLAYKLYQKYPNIPRSEGAPALPSNFAILKQRLLAPLSDWSEFLEKEEVDALTASMQKLEHHPAYQNILGMLIDTHGGTVIAAQGDRRTPMRFSEVWTAYDRVIDYIDANNLIIDEKQFVDAIAQYRGEFNANQFLRRLYEVLQQTGNRYDSNPIQQEILSYLSDIDWHENGFYYACVHEGYRYWDPALGLRNLQRLDNLQASTYAVMWDEPGLVISDVLGFTLRFAAQRLQLPKADFDQYKMKLIQIARSYPENSALFRLITASIAIGLDSVDTIDTLGDGVWRTLSDSRYQPILQQINQCILLDPREQLSRSYHLRTSDLPVLVEVFTEMGADVPLDLETLNALGRALQSFSGRKKDQLKQLIIYGIANGFDHPLITAYPWLVADPIDALPNSEECQIFYKQLRSIDFASAELKLPDKADLTAALGKIHTAESRHAVVSDLIRKKCFITDQDAAFRFLNADDKRLMDELFLSKTFGRQNRHLLEKLFEHLAVKEEGNTPEKIKKLLSCFSNLDRKNYYDELGQLLGLLVEKSRDNQVYSLEQLTIWINTVFDANAFKTKPYPVAFINELLSDALQSGHSSLISPDLHQLKTEEERLKALQVIMGQINVSNLPALAKKTLVKCVIKFKDSDEANLTEIFSRFDAVMVQLKEAPQVMASLCAFITKQLESAPGALLGHMDMLERLASPCSVPDENLKQLWEQNQIKLLEGLETGAIVDDTVTLLVSTADEVVRTILIAALSETDTNLSMLIKMVRSQLMSQLLRPEDLLQLATYYQTDPKPTLQQLNTLLAIQQPVAGLLDHFERVVQAEGKRTYSLTEKDAENIERVINGLKLKKKTIDHDEKAGLLHSLYYINSYSEVQKLADKNNDELFELIQTNKVIGTDEAKARVLACMREIVLRKTGKWVKHTQMLDLIYAVNHNDDNLLHQVRMGEGKSIITIMRVAYRALNGQSGVVFSSKDSLSVRDHQEFSPVLDAFKIRHTHLGANSDPALFQTAVNEYGIGALHYATIGNFGLFLSGTCWENKDAQDPIDLHAENLFAYADEGDHIMRFENTLFNFSDQAEAGSAYNYDAWVYQVASDFYLEHQAEIIDLAFEVNEVSHLQALYQRLQAASLAIAPDKSSYFQKYLGSGDTTLRNQKLLSLLTAAHMAQGLEDGVHFCVMNDQKKLSETATLDTRFAKVMINNQVAHGSTFSELVQQFLHVRLNREAVLKGETPNFFIEPESEIALSLNASYILKKYFKHIEACTGTPGNEEALAYYEDEFDIDRVIKLPTHLDIKTTFLPPTYCQGAGVEDEEEQIMLDEAAHVAAIVAAIQDKPAQPILITCEDDKAVARLGKLIQQALGRRKIVIDTNATGLSEAEISKDAGKEGAITISSRMGRGTDIKPFDLELGLKVIRTYPATPEIVKQEQGRQGRNGAGGACQDIVNYGAIERELATHIGDERFTHLLEIERAHLDVKLAKHTNQDKEIWFAIKQNLTLKNKYLLIRTLQRWKHQIQEASKQRMRDKEALIVEGSGQAMEHVRGLPRSDKKRFKAAWKACKKAIETGWAEDLYGTASRARLDEFYLQNRIRPPHAAQKAERVPERLQRVRNVGASPRELIAFHQNWLKSMHSHAATLGHVPDPSVVTALYGENGDQLDAMYGAFQTLTAEQLAIFTALAAAYPNCHNVPCEAWVTTIEWLETDRDIAETYVDRLNMFFAQNERRPAPENAEEVAAFKKSFLAMVAGAPDIQFLREIIQDNYPVGAHPDLLEMVNQFPRKIVDLCKNSMAPEDVVFFLNALSLSSKADATRCIDYLADHHQQLKETTCMIRPLIALQLQNTEPTVFEELNYSEKTSALLDFLSQRPGFTAKDYQDIHAKVARIGEEHQLQFLTFLSAIPPYISVRSVLSDLSDLPGRHGFDNGSSALQKRINRMTSAGTAFNEFLFAHDLIASKDSFASSIIGDDYLAWHTLFSKMPLDRRDHFFTTIQGLHHLSLALLKTVAETYSVQLSNVQLDREVSKLLQQDAPVVAKKGPGAAEVASGMRLFGNNH